MDKMNIHLLIYLMIKKLLILILSQKIIQIFTKNTFLLIYFLIT